MESWGVFFFGRLDLLRWWKIASRELTWFFFCLEDASVIGFTESCVLKIKLEVEINGLEEIWVFLVHVGLCMF